jgi:hypothetical protein
MMRDYGGIMRRIGGWGGEYRSWMAGVEVMGEKRRNIA